MDSELTTIKRIIKVLDRTLSELASIAQEIKQGQDKQSDAYKVDISDKGRRNSSTAEEN